MEALARRTNKAVLHGALALLVVVGLASSWPAMASTGMAWATPAVSTWLDPLLVFVPLLWAPLPAVAVWYAVEGVEVAAIEVDAES